MSDPVAIAIVTTVGVVAAPILVIIARKLAGIQEQGAATYRMVNDQLSAANAKNTALTAEVLQLQRELGVARQLQSQTERVAQPPAVEPPKVKDERGYTG